MLARERPRFHTTHARPSGLRGSGRLGGLESGDTSKQQPRHFLSQANFAYHVKVRQQGRRDLAKPTNFKRKRGAAAYFTNTRNKIPVTLVTKSRLLSHCDGRFYLK